MAHFAGTAAASPAVAGSGNGSSDDAFWTACPHCCYVHSYPRLYLGRRLRCPTPACRRPFSAEELPSAPPVVPGANMYFCTWAFFPLGPPGVPDGWSPFTPFNPAPPPPPSPAPTPAAATATTTPARARPTSRKKVGVCLKGRARAEAEEEEEADAILDAEAAEVAPKADGLEENGCSGININETVELSELGFRDDELGFLREMP